MTEKLSDEVLRSSPAERIRRRLLSAERFIDHKYGYCRLREDDSTRVADESPNYEETLKYGSELDAYFRYRIDYYPYFKDSFRWRSPFLWHYFVIINEEMIEGKFPRDYDIRALITAYRLANRHNQWKNIRAKRMEQGLFSIVLFLPALFVLWGLIHHVGPPALTMPLASPVKFILSWLFLVVASFVGFRYFLGNSSGRVRDATQSNARDLSGKIQHRLNNLKQNYTEFMKNIATVQFSGLDMDSTEWTNRAKWWAKLALWTPKRIEYIEKFLQSEMQRMRIFILWSDRVGNLSSYAVWVLVSLLGVGVAYMIAGHGPRYVVAGAQAGTHLDFTIAWSLLIAAIAGSLFAALYSMSGKASISVESISQWIGDREWGRFSDIGLHEEFGEVIRQSKEQIRQDNLHGGYGSGNSNAGKSGG